MPNENQSIISFIIMLKIKVTHHAITALQGHFTKISSKVRKLRRERERPVSTVVPTAG